MTKDFALGRFTLATGTFRATRWHRFLPIFVGLAYFPSRRARNVRGLSLNVFDWAWYACVVR